MCVCAHVRTCVRVLKFLFQDKMPLYRDLSRHSLYSALMTAHRSANSTHIDDDDDHDEDDNGDEEGGGANDANDA